MSKFKALAVFVFLILMYYLSYSLWLQNIERATSKSFMSTSLSNKEMLLSDVIDSAYTDISEIDLVKEIKIEMVGLKSKDNFSSLLKKGEYAACKDINKKNNKENGNKISFNYTLSSDNIDEEVNIFDQILEKRSDGIIVSISDVSGFSSQFKMAYDNNTQVIGSAYTSNNNDIAIKVKSDYFKQGQILSSKISDEIKEGNIIAVSSNDKNEGSLLREKGLLDGLNSNNNINLKAIHMNKINDELNEFYYDATIENIYNILDLYIESNNIKAVVFLDGDIFNKSLSYLHNLKEKSVDVFGINNGNTVKKNIENELIKGVILENPYTIGYASVIACVRAILGMPNNSEVNINSYYIDKNNIEDNNINVLLDLWDTKS